jgi:hypothetical protein
MKKTILIILVNISVILAFMISKPKEAMAAPPRIWFDQWPRCPEYGPNYYEHQCWSGNLYTSCLPAPCTYTLGGDPLGQ